jgi:hypothetical protein
VVCKNFVWKKVIIQGLEKILASFERSEGGWLDAGRTERRKNEDERFQGPE